ncbi:MAG TPA: hypothetical protein VER14_02375 [Phototrophicaceae bacterium]|nr:hypothetical protein [Phototrophicaceae bacterium]
MVYRKTLFPCRFTICSKNLLGYAENKGAHRLNFKDKDKDKGKVYLNSLEIGVFLENLPSHYNVDLGRATCHSIKEGLQLEHI